MSHRDAGTLGRAPQDRRRSRDFGEFHNFAPGKGATPSDDLGLFRRLTDLIHRNLVRREPEAALLNRPGGSGRGIPAGYTYLFQLAAHDLAQTSLEAKAHGAAGAVPMNLRRVGLELETVFGGGPMGCPHAYDKAPDGRHTLRLGRVEDRDDPRYHQNQTAWSDPVLDLPRCAFPPEGLAPDATLTDVLIADPRNDDNNLIAQMTVLFHQLYNALVARTDTIATEADRARLARLAAVRTYRRILRADLLPRLLHPAVHSAYAGHPVRLREPREHGSVSLEFAFAAGRVAHAMVRSQYRLTRSLAPVDVRAIIRTSSQHVAGLVPTPKSWVIDWGLFFDLDGQAAQSAEFNWALRFGTHVAVGMTSESAAPALAPDLPTGTVFRDLVRENTGRLSSVEEICAMVRKSGTAFAADPAFAKEGRKDRRKMVRDALNALMARFPQGGRPLDAADVKALSEAPPLNLYLQIEAGAQGNGGATLGPVGSVLVAEAMWPVYEPVTTDAEDAIADDITRRALSGTLPETMPQLIRALRP